MIIIMTAVAQKQTVLIIAYFLAMINLILESPIISKID